MTISSTQVIVRGATVQFATQFFDVNNAPVNPNSATVNIVYSTPTQTLTTVAIPMVAPVSPSMVWKALWDTRGVAPGIVSWSIHTGTGDPIPVTAEDGSFQLSANPANLPTF